MLTIIYEFLKDNFPQIAGYLVLAFVLCWATIKVYSFYRDTKKVCNDHEGMKDQLSLLLDKFNSLIVALNENNAISNPELFNTNSPVSLTEKGKELVGVVGWAKVLEDKEN